MFLDVATIYCKAGNGGNGLVSFLHTKFMPKGGPDGGDGGKGGNVYFEADRSVNTLISFRYTQRFKAGDGGKGEQSNMSGRSGEDIIIKVPCGTVIKDAETGTVIADVYREGDKVLILRGGQGGRGNAKFAGAQRRAPSFSELGETVKERKIILELKTIADVALVGFPNVGKSTILSVISAARPKIADYHFTTLVPNLGVVDVRGEKSFVVADIPGLIEGAAEGAGLGHDFLRHIERVRLIVHVVDISGSEGRNPVEDYRIIRHELKKYSKKLASLPEIIVANKCDLLTERAQLSEFRKKVRKGVLEISAATTEGIERLKDIMAEKLSTLPPAAPLEVEPFSYDNGDKREFSVEKRNGKFYVFGAMLEEFARKVVLSDPDSFRWFQKVMRDKGVIDKLIESGVKDGDTVAILDIEFEYLS